MTNAVCTTYEVVTEATSAFADGKWYVVTNGSEIARGGITVSGTAHLILCDGGSLEVDDVAVPGPTGKAVKYTVNGVVIGGKLHGAAFVKGGTPIACMAE